MFKKLKDKLEEEFKQGPLKFPVSVQQLAQVISPSPSLNSLSDNAANTSAAFNSDPSNVSSDFFSIGDDDEIRDGSSKGSTMAMHSVDLRAGSPPGGAQNRSRRSSLSSVVSEASSLCPIHENSSANNYFQSDLESEMEDGVPGQMEKISKEQLFQSYKKIFNRYNKYKGRYVELLRQYKELQHDNSKTKTVLQESQDKALRRIAELKEQCQLEQNAKAHLEESLRNDMEDRDHMINTLLTKISLLRAGGSEGLNTKDGIVSETEGEPPRKPLEEVDKLKSENEHLQKEVADLKKIKETACHLIHRCDTTIDEATEDVSNENLKRKMSELKSEIQKMKTENESLSDLLSRNVIAEDERKTQNNVDNNLLIDLSSLESSSSSSSSSSSFATTVSSSQGDPRAADKDKKIDKLNNLLLKCKEKISSLTTEVKSKNSIIEEKNKKLKELTEEAESSKKTVSHLTAEIHALKVREEENVLSVAENKMAIHKELETKEEQIKALTKELKTSENEFRKEKDEIVKRYEEKLVEVKEDLARELKYKGSEKENVPEEESGRSAAESAEKLKEWETEFQKMLDVVKGEKSYENFLEVKSAEIERASFRLQERVSMMQKKLMALIERKEKEVESSRSELKRIIENKDKAMNEMKNSITAEHEGSLEKLNLEIRNLTRKVEELETALTDSQRQLEMEKKEKKATTATDGDRLEDGRHERKMQETEKREEGKSSLTQRPRDEGGEGNSEEESELREKCAALERDYREERRRAESLERKKENADAEMESLKRELAKALAESEETSKEAERERKKVEELCEAVKVLEEARGESAQLSEVNKALAEKCESLSREANSLEKELAEADHRSRALEEEFSLLESRFKSARDEADGALERSRLLEERLALRDGELEALKSEMSLKEDAAKSLAEKSEELVRDLELHATQVEELKRKCEALEGERCRVVADSKLKGEEAEKLSSELAAARARIEELAAGEREKTEEVCTLRSRLADEECEMEELRRESREREEMLAKMTIREEELVREKNETSHLLEMRMGELEALRSSLASAKSELSERVNAFRSEKELFASESESKLNILKNEIKFMSAKFEEDIAHVEESRSLEVKELSARLEVAERTSTELVAKLEKITTERDEARAALEEKAGDPSVETPVEDERRVAVVASYEEELEKKKQEVQSLERRLREYDELILKLKASNETCKSSGSEEQEAEVEGEAEEGRTDPVKDENGGKQSEEEAVEGLVAAIPSKEASQNPSESVESIRRQLVQQAAEMKEMKKQHKREVSELRKVIAMKRKSRRNSADSPDWGGTLDNDTEHEYLRNILYEYMMGREQLVLAKVLSAIVKFDKQQTRNVLEREQHRQTLFGQLGIL